MLTAIATTVASAVVLGALGMAWHRVARWTATWRRRNRSDHLTIHAEPWPVHLPPECETPDARLAVACAPSRRLNESALTPAAAAAFGLQQLGFPGEVVYSSIRDGVRLERPQAAGFGIRDHAWVCPNGKLQVSTTVPVHTDPSTGRRVIAVEDILRPLVQMACKVGSPEYRQLHGLSSRAARMKTDWRIGVSMYSRAVDGTPLPSWQDLTFAGAILPRLVPDSPPFCPPLGYAAAELQDWSVNRPVASFLQTSLTSLLAENGYDGLEAVVEAAVAAQLIA